MKRFTVISSFDEYRKKIISRFYPGWKEYRTADELKAAVRAWNRAEADGVSFRVKCPERYPCVVEYYSYCADDDPYQTKQYDFRILYRENFQELAKLFDSDALVA